MPITFGFEAEFASGVPELIGQLTDMGLARQPLSAQPRLHSYHCECESCSDLTIPFRAQRDSSCGGEVISGVFEDTETGWEMATQAMEALQEAALDVDAALSLQCGLHVHLGESLGVQHEQLAGPRTLTMGWAAIEPLLWEHFAGSVWATQRNSNQLLSTSLAHVLMSHSVYVWDEYGHYPDHALKQFSGRFLRSLYGAFMTSVIDEMNWDRHCDLARTHHGGTYEVRIFNASRVAWRIEMACRLSVALAKTEVMRPFADAFHRWMFGTEAGTVPSAATLLEVWPERWQQFIIGYRNNGLARRNSLISDLPVSFDELMTALSASDERLGELLAKQTGYTAARRSHGALSGSAIVSNDFVPIGHDLVLQHLGG